MIRTHTSSWRQAVAYAPLFGAACVAFAALQGEPEILISRNVNVALLAVSLPGWWMAWRLARVLTATPVVAIRDARAGYVALRGTVHPMPGQPALTSPAGAACVWYYYRSGTSGRSDGTTSTAVDSVQPFVLDDGSAKCIVLPAGAAISGGREEGAERLIVAGDAIYVAGEFRPVSADTLQQIRDVEPERADVVRITSSFSSTEDVASFRADAATLSKRADAAKEAMAAASRARAASNSSAPLALPLVCKPAGLDPFIISARADGEHEGSWYGVLAKVNLVLLAASAGMLAYVLSMAR